MFSNQACGARCGVPAPDPDLGFVGNGRGSYIQETTYRYVGPGNGELEYAVEHQKSNNMCISLVGGGTLVVLIALLLWLLFGSTATTTPSPYDCQLGISNAQLGWSEGKKSYCCSKLGVGCATPQPIPQPMPQPMPQPLVPPPAPQPVPVPVPVPVPAPAPMPIVSTSSCPYDCNAGYDEWPMQWVKGWGGAKKLYCCKFANKGCPNQLPAPTGIQASGVPAAPDPGPYDCAAGYRNCYVCLVKHWSSNKLNWCCAQKNIGCRANTKYHM